jgi:hypothetical protein
VLKRTARTNQPVVRVLIGAEGRKLEGFPKRNTRERDFQVVGTVTPAEIRVGQDFRILWDLTTIADAAQTNPLPSQSRFAAERWGKTGMVFTLSRLVNP